MTPHERKRHHMLLTTLWTDPSWQMQTAMCRRISDAVGAAERQFQRMLGAEWSDAYRADWDTVEETYNMLRGPDRTEVLTRFHKIGGSA